MTRVVVDETVSSAEAAIRSAPRTDLVRELEIGPGRFAAERGPFDAYERVVTTEAGPHGTVRVREVTDFRLATGVWSFLFVLPFKAGLRRRHGPGAAPWWAPPDLLDQRAARSLSLLATTVLAAGYLGTLITQTITFAADEFDADKGAQGATLAAVRVGILLSLAITTVADRRGRRRALVVAALGACLVTGLGALAPNLVVLGITQTVARGFSAALGILILVVAAEEMPAGSRAYAVSLLAMTAGLGSGLAVALLPLADLGSTAWRLLYLVPLLFLPALIAIGRRLPESRRYEARHADAGLAGHGRRFALLACSAFLLALFTAPASQFLNEYLRDERGFSAARISLFTLATNTPAGIGIVVAGRLADVRGRRLVGAVGIAGGTLFTVLMYVATGWPIWAWSVLGALVGAATVPALGVYGPELFPTSLRGRANAVISVVGVTGSALGLVAAGWLSEALDSFGPAMALLAVGPAVLAVLIIVAYPETARVELEELNPEDEPPPP